MQQQFQCKVANPVVREQPTSLDRRLIRAAMSAPYLEREEEQQLIARWRDDHDTDALDQITEAHMRLVVSIAIKFRRYNLPLADLIQEGCVGLLEAADRFDPERNVRFSTYATWWIRASIQDYILRNWSIVRGGTSSAQKSLFFNLRRLRAKLLTENQSLSNEEIYERISKQIGVGVRDVEMMDFRFSSTDNSLSSPVSKDEGNTSSKMDLLVDTGPLQDELVSENIDGERRAAWLRQSLSVLNQRELQIIRTRRLSDETATLEALGEVLGISKERVRQIEVRALEKLRMALLVYNEVSVYKI